VSPSARDNKFIRELIRRIIRKHPHALENDLADLILAALDQNNVSLVRWRAVEREGKDQEHVLLVVDGRVDRGWFENSHWTNGLVVSWGYEQEMTVIPSHYASLDVLPSRLRKD